METDEILLGNYRTLVELASGGMGTLYVARQAGAGGFERLVVIKRVHKHLLKSREFVDMFRDEARVASLVRHPNVVSVDDVVEADGELFLVQPYVESITLAELTTAAASRGEKLAPSLVARIVADALLGLEHAHEAVDLRGEPLHLVHRDVSPQNVLVGTDGLARLIDFGIAKAEARATVTSSGVLKGKLPYMAPEQFKKLPIDARADLFASGVVLYEALTGRRPFEGADEGDTLLSILIAEPDKASELNPKVPETLDRVLDKALERERDDRFPTALAFREELEKAVSLASHKDVAREVERLAGSSLEARRKLVRARLELRKDEASAREEAPATPAATVIDAPKKLAPSRRGPMLGVALVATALGAALVVGVAKSRDPGTSPQVASSVAVSASSMAAPEGASSVTLTADLEIESVRAPGLRRVELDGSTARLVLAPLADAVIIEASLRGGVAARARLEVGATSARLERVTASEGSPSLKTSSSVRAPALPSVAVPRPTSAPSSSSELHGNPYGKK